MNQQHTGRATLRHGLLDIEGTKLMNLVQYRMARGALNWTSRQVAAAAELAIASINALQAEGAISKEDMRKIQAAFEAAGVVFLEFGDEGFGVKLIKHGGCASEASPKAG